MLMDHNSTSYSQLRFVYVSQKKNESRILKITKMYKNFEPIIECRNQDTDFNNVKMEV